MLPSDAGTAACLGLGGAGLGNHRVAIDDADALSIVDELWDALDAASDQWGSSVDGSIR